MDAFRAHSRQGRPGEVIGKHCLWVVLPSLCSTCLDEEIPPIEEAVTEVLCNLTPELAAQAQEFKDAARQAIEEHRRHFGIEKRKVRRYKPSNMKERVAELDAECEEMVRFEQEWL